MQPPQIVEQLADVLGRRVTVGTEHDRSGGAGVVDVPFGRGGILRVHDVAPSELDPREWAAIDAAAYLLDLRLGRGRTAGRDRVLAKLVDEESSVRRDALWEVRARHWADGRAESIDLLAVVIENARELRIVAFGRHLATTLHGTLHFVGARRDAALFLASPALDVDGMTSAVETQAALHAVSVRGVALASGGPDDLDVEDTVSRAIRSARLRATLPDHVASVRAEDLGGWALVETLPRSRSLLMQACPAAFVLASAPDQTPRETVEAYLDAAGRASVACQRLHIHRTTLYYRLDQMPEVVRDALADGLQRSTLHLTLKLLRLWDEELRRATPEAPAPLQRERLRA